MPCDFPLTSAIAFRFAMYPMVQLVSTEHGVESMPRLKVQRVPNPSGAHCGNFWRDVEAFKIRPARTDDNEYGRLFGVDGNHILRMDVSLDRDHGEGRVNRPPAIDHAVGCAKTNSLVHIGTNQFVSSTRSFVLEAGIL